MPTSRQFYFNLQQKRSFCFHIVGGKKFKMYSRLEDTREGTEGVELGQPERERVASHLGDIRSLVCEQSHPAGEQSRSLGLRYYKLVGPCVWKCTCCRAGLWLRRAAGGGVGLFCLSAVNLSEFNSYIFTNTHLLYFSVHLTHALLHVLLSSFTSFFSSSYLLFPFSYSPLTTIITVRPAPLLSSCRPLLLPSILQMLVGSRTISRGSW